jgi:hypothetical protein
VWHNLVQAPQVALHPTSSQFLPTVGQNGIALPADTLSLPWHTENGLNPSDAVTNISEPSLNCAIKKCESFRENFSGVRGNPHEIQQVFM